jgi:hypothetical protein
MDDKKRTIVFYFEKSKLNSNFFKMRCILLHCVNKRKRGGLTHSQIFELTSSIPPTLKTAYCYAGLGERELEIDSKLAIAPRGA